MKRSEALGLQTYIEMCLNNTLCESDIKVSQSLSGKLQITTEIGKLNFDWTTFEPVWIDVSCDYDELFRYVDLMSLLFENQIGVLRLLHYSYDNKPILEKDILYDTDNG